ncbi:winged helix-turn-helix domain-containing protein [Streptomyces rimosus]|uniref:winged helix-turn-helix domain-containing protein n=1 Tax=Streptomyces rimosus TaxID=1927 RepID=UPI00131D118D|nr:winged helix-turn-helix domain-containing protein [Streptomyces rimosus]
MAVRFHFTAQDLARTRWAEGPLPLLELGSAVRMLQNPGYQLPFGAWRREARQRLPPQARMLIELNPRWPPGYCVDFTHVTETDPEQAFEAVRATPLPQIREELGRFAAQRRSVPAWLRHLGEDRKLAHRLVDTLEQAYTLLLAPCWQRISALAAADWAVRMRQMSEGGMERVLSNLAPGAISWNPPVLQWNFPAADTDVHLAGRGLLLVPSLLGRWPTSGNTTTPQPWLTYPIRYDEHTTILPRPTPAAALTAVPPSLAALLGRTRASVLCAIADHPGCTTSQLAARTGIAVASASEHAAVLRAAGLTTAVRHRNMTLHTPTPAGLAFLDAPANPVPDVTATKSAKNTQPGT